MPAAFLVAFFAVFLLAAEAGFLVVFLAVVFLVVALLAGALLAAVFLATGFFSGAFLEPLY